ncbi:MAG: aspartate kinase [Ignavibacteria bacterium RBG_16_34_14]|nr:MAG: aspartate kinase [Ignavibacteria bacterium RBG_16_34_14]
MKVLKFGGTSVGSAERMKAVAKLVFNDEPKIVVLSAMSGTTNSLVEISNALYKNKTDQANEIINTLEEKYYKVVDELFSVKEFKEKGKELLSTHFGLIRSLMGDDLSDTEDLSSGQAGKKILSQGELISTGLFHLYLTEQKIDSVLLPALNFMRIDTNSEPDSYYIKENLTRELQLYPDKKLFITQGYICKNLFGEIDNLKRGGSDYTASLIGVAINSEEVQIWTDISGFHNNDPRYVGNTFSISQLSFDEAAELAYFGAKVLHPSTVLPAKLANIPVRLKNTMKPDDEGTLITDKPTGDGIKAIAAKDGITAIKIKSDRMLLAYGFLTKVFQVFEHFETPIDMITTSEVAVSVTIDDASRLRRIVEELKKIGEVEVSKNMTIVCLVGHNIMNQKGYIHKVFEALNYFPLRMISYGGSMHNISILIPSEEKKAVLEALHKSLF